MDNRKTVVAVYTGQGLADPLKKVFQELLPDVRLVNIIDDSLIHDVVQAGEVTPRLARRLIRYYEQGVDIGADIILNTCSSVGEVVDLAQPLLSVPIVKIDELMAQEAVAGYDRIGVVATLPSTLAPTMRLIAAQAARAGKAVAVVDGLAAGAFDALIGGRPEEHDRLILETAARISAGVDAIVLAQGSMARMEEKLREATGKPVLSSPKLGVTAVRRLLETAGGR